MGVSLNQALVTQAELNSIMARIYQVNNGKDLRLFNICGIPKSWNHWSTLAQTTRGALGMA